MKLRTSITLVALTALLSYRLLNNPTICTLVYIFASAVLKFDSDVVRNANADGELEDGIFTHRLIPLTETYQGWPVEVTYHVVECGNPLSEPIVFFHGLAESWAVWKYQMKHFCGTHYVVSVDSEGMGQSSWPHVLRDLPKKNSRAYMADMTMGLLKKLNIDKFNLVVTDYSFWTTLPLLSSYGNIVLRYAKFQSTVGVEDIARIPQAKLFLHLPQLMNWLFNSNPFALIRVLMGHPLIHWLPALQKNSRVGRNAPIDPDVVNNVILKNIPPRPFDAWVYFYHYGLPLPNQMELQINTFRDYAGPVLIVQGADDLGQPPSMFDGTATLRIVETPNPSLLDRLSRPGNTTHMTVTEYSKDGNPIGPTADMFFPKSKWVRLQILEGVGHFVHLEAPDEALAALSELFAVPLN